MYQIYDRITRHNSPFAEFRMTHPGPTEVVPMFAPQMLGEPVRQNGRLKGSALDAPGIGVTFSHEVATHRPYTH